MSPIKDKEQKQAHTQDPMDMNICQKKFKWERKQSNIIDTNRIGNKQYPNTHNDWNKVTFAPSKIAFTVTTLPPIHINIKTRQNVHDISSVSFDSDMKLNNDLINSIYTSLKE